MLIFVLSVLLLALVPSSTPAAPAPPAQSPPAPEAAGPRPLAWAARLGETTVSFEELDRLVLGRHALSQRGREAMLFLLKLRVIEAIARERGMRAEPSDVQAMKDEIEAGVIEAGEARNLAEYLAQQGITAAELDEKLRLAVLHRELTRQALGIPPGEPISGEQQEVWLESQIRERGLEELPAPWEQGVVLRCADTSLGRDEFVEYVRTRLEAAELREMLLELLRVKRMRARMPDLTDKAFENAVQEEIQGRRNEVMSDPQYQGISYEQLLESQGILRATWPEDPAVRQAALARIWVERKYDEESLRRVYEDERELFDGRHGEAIETWVIYLRAAEFKNDLIRSYTEAEKLLHEVHESVTSKADFLQRLQILSEDPGSREKEGLLGWITRPTSASPTREAIFNAFDSGAYHPGAPENALTRLVGPVRTQSGVLLLWLGSRRPAPAWSSMVVYVARELRKRFVDDAVDPREVETYLDTE